MGLALQPAPSEATLGRDGMIQHCVWRCDEGDDNMAAEEANDTG